MKTNFTRKMMSRKSGTKLLAIAALSFLSLNTNAQTTFNYTGSLQTYTVPVGVTSVRIDAQGAQGGSVTVACAATGGRGARMEGDVAVTPGEVLTILVGGQGQNNGEDGGGGGGSFVVRTGNVPLVVAGGGGGASNNIQQCFGNRNGVDASITTSGTASANGLVAGGTPGMGGGANVGSGGGGGGFTGDGVAGNGNPGNNGKSYINGGAGGNGVATDGGGYGGGGAGWFYGGNGGGGGGYAGGGTDGNYPSTYFGGGGGGGSYNIGTNQTNTSGFKTGNGLVVITVLTTPGAGLNFDGTDDYVTIGSPLSSGASYTKEAWINATSTSGNRNIISSPNCVMQISGGTLYAGQSGNLTAVGDATITTGVWIHYAVTYDAATTTMKLYKNGVLVSTNTAVAAYVTENTYIGSDNGSSNCFIGSIDEVRVWNRVLCDAEIQNNRSCEIATTGTGLVRNFHFNQGNATAANPGITSLTDVSASATNGTLTNFALTGSTSNWVSPGAVATGVSCSAFSAAISATSSQSNVMCNGGNTGSATVTATGVGPYTYSWAPSGGNAATASGLAAGTYTCTITNACGGLATVPVTITQPTAMMSMLSSGSIACNGGTTTVVITGMGGTPPYTGTGTFTVTAGTYTYTVTDANGCTSASTVTLTQPSPIVPSVTFTNVLCFGDANGSIDLNVTGGNGPFTYDWNNGTYTTQDISGLTPGTYIGTLTDASGCSQTGTVIITQPASALSASVTTTVNPTTCGGADGSIDITATGGTGAYTYLWNPSAATEDLSSIGAGAYSCTITDVNGCTTTIANTVLSDPNGPSVALAIVSDTLCVSDGATVLTGESPSGGIFSGPGVTAGSFDPGTAGVGTHMIMYSYTDANNCAGLAMDSIYVDICLGTQLPVAAPLFSVQPNPNNGTFTLQLNSTSTAEVMIFDAQGKLVSTQQVQNSTAQLTIGESGVYIVTVITTDGVRTTQRVIVTE